MYKLKMKHHFAAAHQLENAYDNKCNDFMHGHNWIVEVVIKTEQLVNGMVVDFTKIKHVINKLDHKTLNKILDFEPTAENLSFYLQQEILKEALVGRELDESLAVQVTIWEAQNASVTYEE